MSSMRRNSVPLRSTHSLPELSRVLFPNNLYFPLNRWISALICINVRIAYNVIAFMA